MSILCYTVYKYILYIYIYVYTYTVLTFKYTDILINQLVFYTTSGSIGAGPPQWLKYAV